MNPVRITPAWPFFRFALLPLLAFNGLSADFKIEDPDQFQQLFPAGAAVKKLAGDMGFLEGPVWNPSAGGFLVFSDIPANELKKWSAQAGVVTFRKPSQNANGNTLDNQGRLVSAEHTGRRVSVTELDGTVKTLVDSFSGKRFNSPNDVVVKSDDTIWFTDPDYGLTDKSARQLEANYVFRFDPRRQQTTIVARDFDKPNGLCFSPDEKKLFIADSGKSRHIRVFDVSSDGQLQNSKIFATLDKGGPDGIRCDSGGRVWSSSGDGVQVFSPEGQLIGRILLPASAANLCFGGSSGHTLFITARQSLYAVETLVSAPRRPSRFGVFGE